MTEHRADRHTVALMGNPNTGKSSLFNALTGSRQKIANFPGVTVEAKLGKAFLDNAELTIIDLPGTYSMAARSPDERIATEALLGRVPGTPKPDGVVIVLDASSLDRNLYLATQVMEFGLPAVVALTMIDVAESRGVKIDVEALSEALGVPVVPVNSPAGKGVKELKEALHRTLHHPGKEFTLPCPEAFGKAVDDLHDAVCDLSVKLGFKPARPEALRLLVDGAGPFYDECAEVGGKDFTDRFQQLRDRAAEGKSLSMIEAQARYGLIGEWMKEVRGTESDAKPTLTDKVDAVLTHKLWGTMIFVVVMAFLFNALFILAEPVMELVEGGIEGLGAVASDWLPENAEMLRSLVENGIFGGVAAVLVFLPQILILFLFIAILEDLGYMSRAAFLMDRLMSRFGLSGRSFIPLLSSFACAIPGIMGTRVIEDRNTRLTTIFMAPFMSCSARLPVYTLLIAAFVPAERYFGFIGLQGMVLFAMYWVGILFAIPTALVLKRGILKSKITPFLLELPSYKRPRVKAVGRVLLDRGWAFLKRAGTIIFVAAILVWAVSYFPRDAAVNERFDGKLAQAEQRLDERLSAIADDFGPGFDEDERVSEVADKLAALTARYEEDFEEADDDEEAVRELREAFTTAVRGLEDEYGQAFRIADRLYTARVEFATLERTIENERAGELLAASYLGRVGKAVEPAVEPLGWDWRIGMAAIASFPAREVVIATMGTIFSLGEVDEDDATLRDVLQRATREDGSPLFTLAVALSLMVFFALCAQCVATLAVMRRETNSWRWPIFSFLYMTGLAYVAALITYQVASALGG